MSRHHSKVMIEVRFHKRNSFQRSQPTLLVFKANVQVPNGLMIDKNGHETDARPSLQGCSRISGSSDKGQLMARTV